MQLESFDQNLQRVSGGADLCALTLGHGVMNWGSHKGDLPYDLSPLSSLNPPSVRQ